MSSAAMLPRAGRRVRRLLRPGKRGLLRSLVEVLLLGILMVSASGYVRGTSLDAAVAGCVAWLQDTVRGTLADEWVKPVVADVVVLLLTWAGCAGMLLLLASLIRRVPAFIGFLVLSEFHRRQGHNLSALELLVGMSLPVAMTMALVSKSLLSIYACLHFLVCYAYIRLSSDPGRIDGVLNWYVRIRTASDSSVAADYDEANDEE